MKWSVPSCPMRLSHNGKYISVPRAAVTSPRSTHTLGRPAELAKQAGRRALSFEVVTTDEDHVLARYPCGLDHHIAVDGVQCLHHMRRRERPLDPLAEAVGVAD